MKKRLSTKLGAYMNLSTHTSIETQLSKNHPSIGIQSSKNHLYRDLFHSGKYGKKVVKSKKGKGSYKRSKLDPRTFRGN